MPVMREKMIRGMMVISRVLVKALIIGIRTEHISPKDSPRIISMRKLRNIWALSPSFGNRCFFLEFSCPMFPDLSSS
jgi:hypothetical protein